ncbi:MAG: 3-oxoacyl-(acyl-carrier-protein) reductase FabG [Planctomycetes bacterium ADurb.Bin126]|nr:MAG: 3-oxoacyl-(acyl-carrier-protein) reductase FabG [Planctomycetes bacterium ADurb.Bin126]HOD83902.1 3-oxoacyl-[acyl-carrier-protein] reductase [Phycisphaerae bacterium]HQL75485.1 3-oxoacyl-[acyl-carrier-protein] reductase [Phycisphaerae bacterium]
MADKDKVAIVTGAARGIGREIVRELLASGMTVIAVDLREDLLQELPEALGQPGDKLACRTLDVTNSEGFTALVDDVAEKFGRVDVLVNNAGITRDGLLMRMDDKDWDLVLKVNLTSAFYGTRAAAKHMVRQRGGSIVNMASYSGVEGNRGQANYAASKAGMIGLTKTTAKELASKSVRCNAVAPGFIQTEMTDVLPQQAKDMALEQIPMKRFGQPGDIARAVAFLASDASAYITGQVLSVDGGMHT